MNWCKNMNVPQLNSFDFNEMATVWDSMVDCCFSEFFTFDQQVKLRLEYRKIFDQIQKEKDEGRLIVPKYINDEIKSWFINWENLILIAKLET